MTRKDFDNPKYHGYHNAERNRGIVQPKNILAIGGPRHLEMLPYLGMQEYVVPVLSKVKYEDLNELPDPLSSRVSHHFVYYVQTLGDGDARKLVYVGEDLRSVNKAMDLLKDALLKMWVEQPYQEVQTSDPPF